MDLVGVVRYSMTGGNPGIAWHVQRIGVIPKEGESLYVGEPADLAAIREVIIALEDKRLLFLSDKLTLAIGDKP